MASTSPLWESGRRLVYQAGSGIKQKIWILRGITLVNNVCAVSSIQAALFPPPGMKHLAQSDSTSMVAYGWGIMSIAMTVCNSIVAGRAVYSVRINPSTKESLLTTYRLFAPPTSFPVLSNSIRVSANQMIGPVKDPGLFFHVRNQRMPYLLDNSGVVNDGKGFKNIFGMKWGR